MAHNATHEAPLSASAEAPRGRTRWRPSLVTFLVPLLIVGGTATALYPAMASWFSQMNQSKLIKSYREDLDSLDPDAATQLQLAHEYNDALISGAILEAGENIPLGDGSDMGSLDYHSLLRSNSSGLMGRIMIPGIDVDLPVYHGTSEKTLLEGAGHLRGTSLPVGGANTRSVITAHRGLADARMFTDLDRVKVGDLFSVDVVGEVLTYEVIEAKVVQPHETEALRVVEGKDLLTLVTCTPLGVNTHRILVTGERVYPTPASELERAAEDPEVPRFPWWAVGIGASIIVAGGYMWFNGRVKVSPQ